MTLDFNEAISPAFAVRINTMGQLANVAGRNDATDNRWGGAVAVMARPLDGLQIDANYSHTYLTGIPDFGVPYDRAAQLPFTSGYIPRDTFYGFVNRDFTHTHTRYRHSWRRIHAQSVFHDQQQIPRRAFDHRLRRHDPGIAERDEPQPARLDRFRQRSKPLPSHGHGREPDRSHGTISDWRLQEHDRGRRRSLA